MRQVLPRLSYAAFVGDLEGVLDALGMGDDIHQNVRLVNQNGQDVLGATPLYLAAQMGHYDVCKALLRAGADVMRPCTVPATGQQFIAQDIAIMHFNMRTWWLLKEAKQRLAGKTPGLFKKWASKHKKGGKGADVMGEKLVPAGSTPSTYLVLTSGAQMAI
ncbi:hypothetical protein MNEG_9395 [Monoraphidium neglectum]|uniref:Uncharacterized protein n=1 Tax=Monoraphidium neglectum TaxID=145388 RepID=A0A0D2JGP2_9CHLO|nr:hypothetical protein MNEG_9395 [Monoraphidium neglectum]KIY98567.1 hypothetical protein MNEG_9395 [Monoraphidium neglectum]|eukprot:XP_013897587.1 hypothetical protein MNEG_9395 [Monoraphidium neglectum]